MIIDKHIHKELCSLFEDYFGYDETVRYEWLLDFILGENCDWMKTPEWKNMNKGFQEIKDELQIIIRDKKIEDILK